nr:MAG: hypothetical protein EDM05_35700 [Leptolyngbya sp. IPPAS B-1204]RNJ64662.1 MAG: hypothetical protein EDM05_35315 [Leptolyngbya sp. IPPAS B-1204]
MLAAEPETGVVKAGQILQTFVREVAVVLDIQVGEETITCTPEHPFWVPGQGGVQAGELQLGDALISSTGVICEVKNTQAKQERTRVYNIKVEELHTYFVTTLGILVHNANCDPRSQIRLDFPL